MVLTFSDWEHYVDETGSPRTIDWDNLTGTPRAAAVEALRQALIERVSATGGDLAYAIDYPALVTDPISLGVDLDAFARMQAIHDAVWGLANSGSSSSNDPKVCPFADPSNHPTWGAETDLSQGLNPTALTAIVGTPIGDIGSAVWARQIKAALNAMHLAVSSVTPLAEIVRSVYNEEIVIGTAPSEIIQVTGATFAARQAAMDAGTWVPYGAAFQEGTAAGEDYSRGAYRFTSTWHYPASAKARNIELWALLSGSWPEYDTEGFLTLVGSSEAGIAASSIALTRSRVLSELSSWRVDQWGMFGIEDFAVPGGFTFQAEA